MGETDCKRAQAATIGIAGLFAVSAVGAMYALSWLFEAYETGFKDLSTISGTIVFIVAAYVFVEMGITIIDFQDKYPRDLIVNNTEIWVYVVVTGLAVVGLWIRWLRRGSPENASAKRSAIAIVAYAACAAVLFTCLITPTVEDWHKDAAPWYAIAAAIASLIGVAVPISFMLLTTPHRLEDPEEQSGAVPHRNAPNGHKTERLSISQLIHILKPKRSPVRTSPPEHP
jgi:hypothetical protein